ncbi:terminase TerL endonuclease subunit [Treponema denticola]|uniref:terminase TerL endonuclease subunit n=1 Tax=Treponema denticola TaxID=158 RepID=UPI0020A3E94C|nr:terminase TerL endonuclease subunit [Treponema denticola]UTC82647.1 terminase large subunit [Treponema denticola]
MRSEKEVKDLVLNYCKDIKQEKIKSCVYIKLAIKRFESMLKKAPDGYIANWGKLTEVINFAESLFIPDINKNLCLLPWQVFAYAGIYLFTKKENDNAFLTQIAYIEVARKNSKTTSILFPAILYNFLATENAESYFFSGDEKQAKKTFEEITQIVKQSKELNSVCKCWSSSIVFKNSRISFFTSGTKKIDSYKNSFAVLDEYHEYLTDKPLQASLQGMRARKQGGQVLIITTAGLNVTLPCYYESMEAKSMLQGINKNDPSYFALIYTIDKDDDWKDAANLEKANPSIDLITNRKLLEQDLERAIKRPSTQANFLAKTYNIWRNAMGSNWIPPEVWIKQKNKTSDYKNKNAVGAIDLSSIRDLTVFTLYWEDKDFIFAFHKVYIPEETLIERIQKENIGYAQWVESGIVTVTPGATIDYDFLIKDIVNISKECQLSKIAYDPWHAQSLIKDLEKELPADVSLIEFKQNLASISEPSKLFEKNILDKKIVDKNPVMAWALSNVVIKADVNGNIKPLKLNEGAKIDPVITSIMAHYLLISGTDEKNKKYTAADLLKAL